MDDPPDDCEPDWDDDEEPLRIHPDLHGQGLTAIEIHTLTDVPITGSYL